MSAQSLVAHYRDTFEKQRGNIIDGLQSIPGYKNISSISEAKLWKALDAISGCGVNGSNAILAIDGSFSFGMAVGGSDLDGALYILDPTEGPIMKVLNTHIDSALENIGITSNIRVTSSLWSPSRDKNDPLGRAEEIAVHTLPLLSGQYVWGQFDSNRIISMLHDPDSYLLKKIDSVYDERFWFMMRETETKYLERITQSQANSKESKE